MLPIPDLPDLRIVPLESLVLHERMDPRRAPPLVDALRADGVLRNPPIVHPVSQRGERFVVLDGANRSTAFKLLGIGHILVQVVHAGNTAVQLETWNHVLSCLAPQGLTEALERFPDLTIIPSDLDRAAYNVSVGASLAYVSLRDGNALEVVGETRPLDWRVRNLNLLVGAYRDRCQLARTTARTAVGLERVFPDLSGLMVFPRFEQEEVLQAASAGWLLPAGLTRFIISPRALRLNYPLERLASDRPLEAKRAELEGWLREKADARRVRYYAESTFLFDE
jgi:L-serine kinase (ATP) / ParB family transcriptional regulator, heme-responsive regulator